MSEIKPIKVGQTTSVGFSWEQILNDAGVWFLLFLGCLPFLYIIILIFYINLFYHFWAVVEGSLPMSDMKYKQLHKQKDDAPPKASCLLPHPTLWHSKKSPVEISFGIWGF